VLDKLTYAGSEENLAEVGKDPRLRFVRGDICDGALVEKLAPDVDAIVNFAAETHVDRSLLDAGSFVQTDVYGTYVLLEVVRKLRLQRFLQVSTDEVYGHVKDGKSRETDPLLPRSPYSASKAAAEMLVHAYNKSYGLPTVVTRGANTYGPYQFPEKIVPLFITNAMQDLPLPVYGSGKAVRDYIYVDDHAEAIARVLWKGDLGEVYNIGAGLEVSGVEVAETVLSLCGKPSSLRHFVKDRPGHDYRYSLEASRMRKLGWQPLMNFREGLRETVEWYRRHEDWWRKRKSPEFWDYYRRNYEGLPPSAIPN
jgi:dTDP-glucose 4,6-dehydratase